MIDVLDDNSIIVKDNLVIDNPRVWKKQRFFVVIKGAKKGKISIDTTDYEGKKGNLGAIKGLANNASSIPTQEKTAQNFPLAEQVAEEEAN